MTPDTTEPKAAAVFDRLVTDAIRLARKRRRTPGATYRMQFRKEFTLADALQLVPYLHSLGVTHVYASPILKARSGSPHGYDVVDHGTLNPEIGTEADFAALTQALADRQMGLILDAVPNHMCISGDNPWWVDVLEHGPSSPYAASFDIDWYDAPRSGLSGRLLLPVLGDPYGTVLESGQFKLTFESGQFSAWYYDTRLPIDPRTYGKVLAPAVADLMARVGVEHPDTIELISILNSVGNLPPRAEPDAGRVVAGRIEMAAIKRRLGELGGRFPAAAGAVQSAVQKLAGTPGDPASFTALDELLEAQAYRPCFWRVASDEINYRRFFDVNELAAVSTEREDVFRAVHRKLFGWLAAGQADGLRIDHPDGLYDPKQYLDRLQAYYLLAVAERLCKDTPGAYPGVEWERDEGLVLERVTARYPWPDDTLDAPSPVGPSNGTAPPPRPKHFPLYVVVEKILGDHEPLQSDWACDGTTGYEFLYVVNNLFVDPAGEARFTKLYQEFTGQTDPLSQVIYEKKAQILSSSLSSELTAISHQLDRLARLDRRSRDFTLNGIRRALREVIACFPVYRSYVNGGVHDSDKAVIGRAVTRARKRNPMLGKPIYDFVRNTLLLKDPPSGVATEEYRNLQRRFTGKFQQVTAPVTAKGIEDTAFYTYNRFISLNEVGGEPGRFGWPPERVHDYLAERMATSPGGLSPLSTHDTKRSEDVRARLNVLSEIPGEWTDRIGRWSHLNSRHRTELEDGAAPDANEEYLIYQTVVGVWPSPAPSRAPSPDFVARIQAYVKKAMCEAKVHSSWINPDPDYEAAIAKFVDGILNPAESADFLKDLRQFVDRIGFFGRINSLAQTMIRCTAPGVPDTYQGAEGWDFSLVDPDNRRPVDYAARQAWLRDLDSDAGGDGRTTARLAQNLTHDLADPRVKIFTVSRALRCRRDRSELFASGDYTPVKAAGDKADHAFCFLRQRGDQAALVLVPRLSVGLVPKADMPPTGQPVWGETVIQLPEEFHGVRWENALTGESIAMSGLQLRVADVLGTFPVALLLRGS